MEGIKDTLTFEEFTQLADYTNKVCISIYMPTFNVGEKIQENSIRFKNLLRQAEENLKEQNIEDSSALLQPAYKLLDDQEFWQHQHKGLAMFVSKDFFTIYRVPIQLDELCVVNTRFHLKRLIKLFSDNGNFYLLSLTQDNVELYSCSKFDCQQIELKNIPTNITEALGEEIVTTTLQFHSASAPNNPQGRGGYSPTYHGQGSFKDQDKNKIQRYFQVLDKALHSILKDQKDPLVLACVDYYLPLYRDVNSYPHLFAKSVEGDPTSINIHDLHEKALKIIKPHFNQKRDEIVEVYNSISGTAKASHQTDSIIEAAFNGRVDTLFVASGIHIWGQFNEADGSIKVDQHQTQYNFDLLDFAAINTIKNGGRVFVMNPDSMPQETIVAAIYRF
jgi:hypothetical protein